MCAFVLLSILNTIWENSIQNMLRFIIIIIIIYLQQGLYNFQQIKRTFVVEESIHAFVDESNPSLLDGAKVDDHLDFD